MPVGTLISSGDISSKIVETSWIALISFGVISKVLRFKQTTHILLLALEWLLWPLFLEEDIFVKIEVGFLRKFQN